MSVFMEIIYLVSITSSFSISSTLQSASTIESSSFVSLILLICVNLK